ncbi:DUF2591 family protein [Morganella morganii]|nr:DUF2591 family protein [Morganella morganii]
MNKYRDKSYFEINELVSFSLGYVHTKSFDPCNNPADAMPIIIENGISMIKSSGGWICCHGVAGVIEHENLYRAAMELFLMMKDAENEK